jgi:exodeoxyribonuclease-3
MGARSCCTRAPMKRTLCTLNANGLRAAETKGFSAWLERHAPDLLCLQELRALPSQVPDGVRSPAGYNSRWLCAEKKGYSGVAVYSREAADGYAEGCGLGWADREGRVLRADLGELVLVSVYVPSGSSSDERQARKFEFLAHLEEHLAPLLDLDRPVAVCGDVNIAHTELDIWSPKTNAKNSGFLPEERAWLGGLLEAGWVDVLREQHPGVAGLYSWWSNRGQARAKDRGWRIDQVLGNAAFAERVTGAWIEKDAGLSDHAPVWVEFEGD